MKINDVLRNEQLRHQLLLKLTRVPIGEQTDVVLKTPHGNLVIKVSPVFDRFPKPEPPPIRLVCSWCGKSKCRCKLFATLFTTVVLLYVIVMAVFAVVSILE